MKMLFSFAIWLSFGRARILMCYTLLQICRSDSVYGSGECTGDELLPQGTMNGERTISLHT